MWDPDGEKNIAIDTLIKTNPVCAEVVFDNMIGTNGKEEDSKDLMKVSGDRTSDDASSDDASSDDEFSRREKRN